MRRKTVSAGRYVVQFSEQQLANMKKDANGNPLKVDKEGNVLSVFKQGGRAWYEGEIYDGNAPENPLRRGFLRSEGREEEVDDGDTE